MLRHASPGIIGAIFKSKGRRQHMLEKMCDFFDARLDGYEEHQLTAIDGADGFYSYTASLLPRKDDAEILDLGCGTGLELDRYFPLCPTARVTGIDLAPGMLSALRKKHRSRALTLICASYFDVPLGDCRFDAAVSVESLHHFTKAEKLPLYEKLRRALRPGGCFILTDYFADTDEQERFFRSELCRLKSEQNIADGEFYHYDTPLTVAHETEALYDAGFSDVEPLRSWGSTHTLRAVR